MADSEDKGGSFNYESVENMKARMLAFIFPNKPVTVEQVTAFEQAVMAQLVYEQNNAPEGEALAVLKSLPNGVESFTIGTFSMKFDGSYNKNETLSKSTVCPQAYWLLLDSSLLYRGVMGGCCCGSD